MSCGGDSKNNRNATAIRDALAASPGTLTVAQAREAFHRLSDEHRKAAAARERAAAGGERLSWARARELTQEAHAHARAMLGREVAAVRAVLDANEPNTALYAAEAADWAARDPEIAAMFTPEQAALEVRKTRLHKVFTAIALSDPNASPEDRAGGAIDVNPAEAGFGGGVAELGFAAKERAWTCGTPEEQKARHAAARRGDKGRAEWEQVMPAEEARLRAVEERCRRVASIQRSWGLAELDGAENWESVVDHDRPYGPGLQSRWEALDDRARTVMRMRKGIPGPHGPAAHHTLDETGSHLGISREKVRQIQSKAERHLRGR